MVKYACQFDSIKKHVRYVSFHRGIFRDSWAIGALMEGADESLDDLNMTDGITGMWWE